MNQGGPYQSSDNFGHGTATASVATGTTYGVAKNAIMHSVRISGDASGTTQTSIETCGINWVSVFGVKPAVASMSFGGVPSAFAVRDAINNVANSGITFVKAAGNDGIDAFQDRSNRGTNELVVGATDPTNDAFASFSDFGPTISLNAPGVNVLVADKFNPGFGKLGSGTSFSAPYVAGTAAQLLQRAPFYTPANVFSSIASTQCAAKSNDLNLVISTHTVLFEWARPLVRIARVVTAISFRKTFIAYDKLN